MSPLSILILIIAEGWAAALPTYIPTNTDFMNDTLSPSVPFAHKYHSIVTQNHVTSFISPQSTESQQVVTYKQDSGTIQFLSLFPF